MSGSSAVRVACFGTPSLATDGVAAAVAVAGARWCGVAESASAMFRLVARGEVDVLLVDFSADRQLCVCELLANAGGGLCVVLWHGFENLPDDIEVPEGVRAVLSLRSAQAEFVQLIHEIAPKRAHPLSPRESQVLQMIARGYNTPHMARVLLVGNETVRTYVRHVLVKLGAHNRSHAVALACARGLISVPVQDSAPGL